MDTTEKVIRLKSRILALRKEQPHIKKFPDDVRKDVIFLIGELGVSKTARELCLTPTMLYQWKEQTLLKKEEVPPLSITRVCINGDDKKPDSRFNLIFRWKSFIIRVSHGEME